LANERATTQKLETNKMLFERQNKELKAKLAEIETNQRVKTKTAISNLESKIANLDEQLETEAKYVYKKKNLDCFKQIFCCMVFVMYCNF